MFQLYCHWNHLGEKLFSATKKTILNKKSFDTYSHAKVTLTDINYITLSQKSGEYVNI